MQADPPSSGWFGREGLTIDMTLQLDEPSFRQYVQQVTAASPWSPLPIPDSMLRRLAGIETIRQSNGALAQAKRGSHSPEGAAVYQPTDAQLLAQFVATLPPQPQHGHYQVLVSGTDILHAPRRVLINPVRDVNDFILVMLDQERHRVLVKVKTWY
jgi:hypothetical protein